MDTIDISESINERMIPSTKTSLPSIGLPITLHHHRLADMSQFMGLVANISRDMRTDRLQPFLIRLKVEIKYKDYLRMQVT